MKKILIVSHDMQIGGVERALLGLLENIDADKVQVDLFLFRHDGELLGDIPDYVNLLPSIPAYTVLARPIATTIKEGHLILSVARLFGKYRAKQYVKKHRLSSSVVAIEYSHKYTKCFMPPIQPEVEYDLAISFLTPHYFVTEKVRAKKKIAWIHTDYSSVQSDVKSELKMWSSYDYIASISDNVTETFLSVFPSLKNKIVLIENILPKTLIQQQTDAFSVENEMPKDGSIRLLSVGRFSAEKNFDSIPDICRRIIEEKVNVKWYIIGYGSDEELIRKKISESKMDNRVIILGKKENPYPYIKACDLYIQPSRYEGKAVTVREAQMLSKPVVITRYATSSSQLEEGVDGVIVPLDNKGCASGIIKLIQNKALQYRLIEKTEERDYTNAGEIAKLYNLLENVK